MAFRVSSHHSAPQTTVNPVPVHSERGKKMPGETGKFRIAYGKFPFMAARTGRTPAYLRKRVVSGYQVAQMRPAQSTKYGDSHARYHANYVNRLPPNQEFLL